MLKLDVRVGESVEITGNGVTFTLRVENKSGQRTRLAIAAPGDVKIRTLEGGTAAEYARRGLKPFR